MALMNYLITLLISINILVLAQVNENKNLNLKIKNFNSLISEKKTAFPYPAGTKIDSFTVEDSIKLFFNKRLTVFIFRPDNYNILINELESHFLSAGDKRKIAPYWNNFPVHYLIPNFYKISAISHDLARYPLNRGERKPFIKNISKNLNFSNGLSGRNIAMWHSHGWLYSHSSDRWEWQRARLFQTVEDKVPMSFVLPFLAPMLENAGATVFLPRERDFQINEVLVDNNFSTILKGQYIENPEIEFFESNSIGFDAGSGSYPANFNPFTQGSFRKFKPVFENSTAISWIPDIPESGFYNVYVSYGLDEGDKNSTGAIYTVNHQGGSTVFQIDQNSGYSTWILLGNFLFNKGIHNNQGVFLSTMGIDDGYITADAVRFGGGMGVVERNGSTSGRPKYLEGARYYLQYSGMDPDLVFNINGDSLDYIDDYQSRGEWVNFLMGAPFGPNLDRSVKGLNIPIDLSLAFHTDAGNTKGDTVIGTLQIYSLTDIKLNTVFPDGVSRFANRDFSDILQTIIVDDTRKLYDSSWRRREIWDSRYAEAVRPNVPSSLLELFSHQNFADSKFFSDPRYRFDLSRSIYKAMVYFINSQNNIPVVIAPLPPVSLAVIAKNDEITLTWEGVEDPLESTATPETYRVYRRINNGGFDNGRIVFQNSFIDSDIEKDNIYGYYITAVNKGGESMPSEILAAAISSKSSKNALIVNNFYRICGPPIIDNDSIRGFDSRFDHGMPYKYDLSFIGYQFNFDPNSVFVDNDNTGFGASFGDHEENVIAGNTFDYPAVHGSSILKTGYSISSASSKAFLENDFSTGNFDLIDIIFGEQKYTERKFGLGNVFKGDKFVAWSPVLIKKLDNYLTSGKKLIISGSYIGSDLQNPQYIADSLHHFAIEKLGFKLNNEFGSRSGKLFPVKNFKIFYDSNAGYNNTLSDKQYMVLNPNSLKTTGKSEVLFRFADVTSPSIIGLKSNYSVVSSSVPLESITDEKTRDELFKALIKYLEK